MQEKRKNRPIIFKESDDRKKLLEMMANKQGMTTSDYMRRKLFDDNPDMHSIPTRMDKLENKVSKLEKVIRVIKRLSPWDIDKEMKRR